MFDEFGQTCVMLTFVPDIRSLCMNDFKKPGARDRYLFPYYGYTPELHFSDKPYFDYGCASAYYGDAALGYKVMFTRKALHGGF